MQNKTALVTRATSGIGRVTAWSFTRKGAATIIVVGQQIKAREVVTIQSEAGNAARFLSADRPLVCQRLKSPFLRVLPQVRPSGCAGK